MAGVPTHAELSAINARMVGQFLAQDQQPLTDGHYAVRVLESRGRATGQPRRTPLGLTQVDGNRYLVSPVRDRDWVRNLAAEPRCALIDRDGSHPRIAFAVHGSEAVTAVATYLSTMRVPWAVRAFPVAPDASAEQIAAQLDTMAVFRLDDVEEDAR